MIQKTSLRGAEKKSRRQQPAGVWTDYGVVQRQESHMLETHHDQQEATFFASCIELLVKLKFVASSQYKSRANPVQQNLPEIGCHYQVHLTNNEWRLA